MVQNWLNQVLWRNCSHAFKEIKKIESSIQSSWLCWLKKATFHVYSFKSLLLKTCCFKCLKNIGTYHLINILPVITIKFYCLLKKFSFFVLCCKVIRQKMTQYTRETVNQVLDKICNTEHLTDGENMLVSLTFGCFLLHWQRGSSDISMFSLCTFSALLLRYWC